MYKSQSKESKEKQKFRQSGRWKKFRAFLKSECNNTDYITQKKLLKGFQVHHKDMRLENYQNISDKNRFLCCNKNTHKLIHFLFTYYKADKEILTRLQVILEDMVKMNAD